jgi:hypothetical protein
VSVTGVGDVTHKKHHVARSHVTFSGPVHTVQADGKAAQRQHHSDTTRNAGTIPLRSASHFWATHAVPLIPRGPLRIT